MANKVARFSDPNLERQVVELVRGINVTDTELNAKFDPTTGHKHTGAAGDGPKLTHDAIDTAQVSAFRAYQSTEQSIPDGAWTKVAFQTEEYDHLNEYDTTTYRFTAAKSGLYLVSAAVYLSVQYYSAIYKNGSMYARLMITSSEAASSTIVKLNAGDFLEIYVYASSSGTVDWGSQDTYFTVARIA